jgi:hypothetical protein
MLPFEDKHETWTVYDEMALNVHKINKIRGPTELQGTLTRN